MTNSKTPWKPLDISYSERFGSAQYSLTVDKDLYIYLMKVFYRTSLLGTKERLAVAASRSEVSENTLSEYVNRAPFTDIGSPEFSKIEREPDAIFAIKEDQTSINPFLSLWNLLTQGDKSAARLDNLKAKIIARISSDA